MLCRNSARGTLPWSKVADESVSSSTGARRSKCRSGASSHPRCDRAMFDIWNASLQPGSEDELLGSATQLCARGMIIKSPERRSHGLLRPVTTVRWHSTSKPAPCTLTHWPTAWARVDQSSSNASSINSLLATNLRIPASTCSRVFFRGTSLPSNDVRARAWRYAGADGALAHQS
ncbi:hypothetical protein OH76DRAFT_139098 [Lentinus brumalis]|uniref:Uncharacterized protein n=1 Tax=Lentinus brumalis TaxID=2498619 RepID=A0A371CPQ6_9APHY|nr:hypothetical protein OH76DRAFT_139098 [Polyporus brumalis]